MDPNQLRDIVKQRLGGRRFILVSNREPYSHTYMGEAVHWVRPASGLVSALEPVMEACGGLWVAHGSGDADHEVTDADGKIQVPPDAPRYTLKRVWLTKDEERSYYDGFANQAIWPLCHVAYTRPQFEERHWTAYVDVNKKFARAILDEIDEEPAFVFVQDYHFALLPRILKEERPDVIVAQFWHIPWPNPEAFAICPWAPQLLDGLLGNDLLGFHIQQYCNNFMNTVERSIEAVVDYEHFSVQRQGKRTFVRPFPISVDTASLSEEAQDPAVVQATERLRHELGLRGQIIGLGVDRIDYTKGIPERLRAIDRFLELYPEYQGRFSFVQIGALSRIRIPAYEMLNDEIYRLMVTINAKWEVGRWRPIHLLKTTYSPEDLLAFYRLADVCIVSPLHDGMNLVAKEFVSCRTDGVLLLSGFTGAARELTDAVLINPYHTDGFAAALNVALSMPLEEQQRRMQRMRETLAENDIYSWAARIITDIGRLA